MRSPNYKREIFLAFDLGHRCAKIDVKYFSIWCEQCGNRFHASLFGFLYSITVQTKVNNLDFIESYKPNKVALSRNTNAATGVVEN